MANLNAMVRIGIVSDVTGTGKARVYYPDMDNMVSDWLYVLSYPGLFITASASGNHDHGGEVLSAGSHSHLITVQGWMPRIDDTVLVLYAHGFNADGYILGVIR